MYQAIAKQFKPLSAEDDENFKYHFIETKYINRILTNESDVIFGTKGTGKTALSTALTDLNKGEYLNTNTLNLDTLSFNRLSKNIEVLKDLIEEDTFKISRIAWKNTLLNSAIFALSEVLEDYNLKSNIYDILNDDGFIKNSQDIKDSDEKVNSVLENFLLKIQNLPFTNKGIGKYSAEDNNSINEFPLNDKTSLILNDLIQYVSKKGKKILISIDGLDSIADHSFESRNIIFTGLIDAVFNLRLDKNISKAFIFKAFLPHELTIDSNMKIWDSDKHLNNTHFINWSKDSLKDFLLKRLFKFSKNNSGKFEEVWKGIMPEKIKNPIYGVEENSVDYILRHTLYRPRQLQKHFYHILNSWIESTGGDSKIHSDFIPNIIAQSNLILADKVSQQLSLIYPGFISFMKSFNNSGTCMEFGTFKDRVYEYFLINKDNVSKKKINDFIDEFYIFGIFGIEISSKDAHFKTKKKDFHFSFVNDSVITSIYSTLKNTDRVAFSPMFREFCGMNKENKYIVNPVKKNDYY